MKKRVIINEGYFTAVKGKRTPGVQIKNKPEKSHIIVQMKSPNLKESPGTGIENKQNLMMI